MNIWYGMGALYVVIFIHTRYKICLILVVCCVWENIIRVQGKVYKKKKKKKKNKKKKKKKKKNP